MWGWGSEAGLFGVEPPSSAEVSGVVRPICSRVVLPSHMF